MKLIGYIKLINLKAAIVNLNQTICCFINSANTLSVGKIYGLNCGNNSKELRIAHNMKWLAQKEDFVCIDKCMVVDWVKTKPIEICKEKEIECGDGIVPCPQEALVISNNECVDSCIYVEAK